MPVAEHRAVCAAPALSVWRLAHDPARLGDWMADTARVERAGEEGVVTRYLHGWPDHPMPTRVRPGAATGPVVISCLVSDIEIVVALEPHPAGCAVRITATVPDGEADRLDAIDGLVRGSLDRLVARAAREDPLG